MSCPTCSHTMQGVGYGVFHCPRCGTMKGPIGEVVTPALVERCREYERGALDMDTDPVAVSEWERLGIAESINTPANRSHA
jgi:tRNA(Ile2) C34 agmatinyltransferase TiaS